MRERGGKGKKEETGVESLELCNVHQRVAQSEGDRNERGMSEPFHVANEALKRTKPLANFGPCLRNRLACLSGKFGSFF